jgi:chromatin segregation and condensation protein Rec8/ScpA/Scc1 (kleisin family)
MICEKEREHNREIPFEKMHKPEVLVKKQDSLQQDSSLVEESLTRERLLRRDHHTRFVKKKYSGLRFQSHCKNHATWTRK